jgi:hypothetical protein
LIAADIDKTILAQNAHERQQFMLAVAPKLLESASLGAHLAFVTGNSMNELCSRFLRWLVAQLCHTGELKLLEHFHFFCNSGGVYARFPLSDASIGAMVETADPNAVEVLECLTERHTDGKLQIRAQYIDSSYIGRSRIPERDRQAILASVAVPIHRYVQRVADPNAKHLAKYDLRSVSNDDGVIAPEVDLRTIQHGSHGAGEHSDTVQVTINSPW